MWPVSERWRASAAGVPRWVSAVDWSLDGRTWRPAKLHEGTVTDDATSQVRWSLDAVVSGVTVSREEVSPFGVLLRARIGMVHGLDDIEWVPLGQYRCSMTDRAFRGGTVALEGESFEAALIDDEFPSVRQFPAQAASQLVTTLIRETMPSARVQFTVPDEDVPAFVTEDESRWNVIDGKNDSPSVARALGARVATDRAGTFVVAATPSLEDPTVGTVDAGPGGLLVESRERLTREGVYNRVAVRGESSDPDVPPVGPFIVEDDDPLSPTYTRNDPLRGGYGAVTFHYASPLVTNRLVALRTGQGLLAPKLGLRQQVDFRSRFDPSRDSGDVLLVRSPAGLRPTLLDRNVIDLVNFTMESACRATQTRLAGTATTLATQTGGEGDAE